jgi:hypothetical protein
MKADGTGRHKITSQRILDSGAVSPDGRWVVAAIPNSNEEHMSSAAAIAVDGSTTVPLCVGYCNLSWDKAGRFIYLYYQELGESTYVIPVKQNTGLPKTPPGGFATLDDMTKAKAGPLIPWFVESAVSPSVYAYVRENTRSNLYRIPLQ